MLLYISIVDETATDPHLMIESLKFIPFKKPSTIPKKILSMISSLASGTQRIWKFLMNLGDRGNRPPLGGAAEAIIV